MAHSKLYTRLMNSARWQRLRLQYLTAHPLCEQCQAEGRVQAAQCVHHVVPIESGRTDAECTGLAFAWNNLRALCYPHHAEIHRSEHARGKDIHHERALQRLDAWIARNKAARVKGSIVKS